MRQVHKVVKYPGKNINVSEHNEEMREASAYESVSFAKSFNMGDETFSKPWVAFKMNPVWGTRGEYVALLLIVWFTCIFRNSRAKNEEGIRESAGFADNKFAPLDVIQPRKWK